MTVYKTMQNILAIQQRKADDKIKDEERQKRRAVLMAETGMTFEDDAEDDEPKEEETKGAKKGKKKKEVEIDPEELERRKAEAAKKKDIATYGRTWIWEDYHEEKEEINALWMAGQDAISRINVQVLEDIEDVIVMKTFSQPKISNAAVQKLIDENLETQRNRERMHQAAVIEEEMKHADETNPPPKHPDIIEEGKVEDKKRTFMAPYRPHEMIWNFIYDDAKQRPKHVLRPDADPTKCYIDGRIQKLLAMVE